MAENNDVEVRITGSVDPSLAASTNVAKVAIADLGSAADRLTVTQRSMAQAIVEGRLSLDALQQYLGKSTEAKMAFAAITDVVTQAQLTEVETAEKAAAAHISLSSAELAGMERAASFEAAANAKTAADLANINRLRAQQVGSNFARDVNLTTGVTGLSDKSAKESAAVFAAAEAEKTAALKARAAAELATATEAARQVRQDEAVAATAERVAAAQAKVVTSAVPLYAAKQRLATVTEAANASLAAGAITEEENAAAVAAATNAYNIKVAALIKSGEAIALETGEVVANTVVQEVNTAAVLNNRVAYEATVLVHEAMQGRFSRMAGSSVILGQALAGQANTTKFVTSLMGPLGIALGAAAAAAVAFGVAMHQATKDAEWAEQLKRTADTLGVTTTRLQEFDFVFKSMGIDVEKGRHTLEGLERTIGQVEAGGTRAKQITKLFKEELNITPDQLRGWGDLNTQIPQVIDALSKMNVEERATAEKRLKVDPEVIQSLIDEKNRIGDLIAEAHKYGIIIPADVIETSAAAADKMREWKTITDGELRAAFIRLAPLIAGGAKGIADLAEKFSDGVRGVTDIAKSFHAAYVAIKDFGEKIEKVIPFVKTLDQLFGIAPEGVKRTNTALDHTKTILMDMINPLGAVIRELERLGALDRIKDEKKIAAEPKTPPGPPPVRLLSDNVGKGPSIVQVWTEQLHRQEIASNEFFKDQTEKELHFWETKVGFTRKGSKEWLEVQEKIYVAHKKLAHDDYEDHIASLGVRLEADRDNWTKEQADWKEKLDYIKLKFGEEGKEYKNAYREFEAAQREHARTEREIARAANQEMLSELRNTLATEKSIREANAHEAESEVQYKAKYSGNPLAQVQAEQQIAAIHRQVAQQNLSDMEQEHAKADQLLSSDIENAKVSAAEYAKAVDAKRKADLEFANQHRQLMNQMANQERADAQKIAQTWHSVVDPMVKTTGDQIIGLIKGTESWGQALANIGEQALSQVVSAIERMVEAWIIGLITGKAEQSTTAVAQVISYAGVAGAAGVASMAGAPFPIDLGAPAFGAAMAADAAAYGAMASLDTGTNYVPGDMVAKIHEGERIVPKADNTTLMSALTGDTNRGGDFHGDFGVHLHGDADKMDGRKIIKALEGSQSHFSKLLKGMHRNGHFAYAG